MNELIQKLETAVLRRNPALAESFQPGLSPEKIKKELNKVGINGALEPVIELYSWKNGTVLQGTSETFHAGLKGGFTPPMVIQLSEEIKQTLLASVGIKRETDIEAYHFIPLRKASITVRSFPEYAQTYPKLSIVIGRYFPFLWNGSSDHIAVDIKPGSGSRVVTIQTQEEYPLREAYASFEEFLKDAIRANENNEPLACLRAPGKPITA